MYPSLVLSAALLAPAAPIPRDTVPNATGPAPRVLSLKADDGGAVRVVGTIALKVTVTNTYFVIEEVVENGQTVHRQVQKQVDQDVVTAQYFNKSLAEFNGKFTTAAGAPLTLEEATGRVKNGATVLASTDGKPVAKAWLKAVDSDTVVMVAEGLAHAQVQSGSPTAPGIPMPALTMLGADADGKVRAPCTSAPLSADLGYYNDMMFEGRVAFRGRGGVRNFAMHDVQQQDAAKVIRKPLADVTFDAYDLTGKRIPKSDALKRLAAGGLVIVAGDNRMPDETCLKGFQRDLIVLVGSELVLPVVPLDQTKKKEPVKEPMAPPAAQPAPVVKPGIVIKGRAAGNAAPVVPPEKK